VIALAVCCAAIFWAARTVWENSHPAVAIAQAMRSADPDQRLAAIREVAVLAADDSGAVIPPLVTALKDPVPGVRSAAAQSLGTMGSKAITAGTKAEAVRAAAQGLFAALNDPDASVRSEATRELATLADLASETSRRSAGRGKAKAADAAAPPAPNLIDLKEVVAGILELLGDPDIEVRRATLLAIGNVAPKVYGNPPEGLFKAIEDESPIIREAAITASAGFSHDLDALVPSLLRHAEHDDPAVKGASLQALGRINPRALSKSVTPVLTEGLRSRSPDLRLQLVSLIGKMPPDPTATVPALIDVLRETDKSDQARMAGQMAMTVYAGPAQEAAQVLGRIAPGTPAAGQAIAALAGVVRAGPPPRRAASARALAQFGPAASEAVTGLIAMLKLAAASEQITEDGPAAARALGRIAPGTSRARDAVDALTTALKANSAPMREAAVEGIRSFGPAAASDPATISTLRELEKDRMPNIRKAATSALEALKAGSH
jgi:HEAT repeat protein